MDTTKKKHKRWNRAKCLKKLNKKTLYGHYLWCKKEGRDIRSLQLAMNFKKNMWNAPNEFKDLTGYNEIAIDLETKDEGITNGLGAGWASGRGEIIGFAVAVEGWQGYFPFGHYGGGNLIPEQVKQYMKDVCSLPATKIFHNAQYDVGWLKASGIEVKGQIVHCLSIILVKLKLSLI
jgi:hypothetical protein